MEWNIITMQKTQSFVPKISHLRSYHSPDRQLRSLQFQARLYLTHKHNSQHNLLSKLPIQPRGHPQTHSQPSSPTITPPHPSSNTSSQPFLRLKSKKAGPSQLHRRKRQIDWSVLDPLRHVSRYNSWELKFYQRVKHKLPLSQQP